MGSKALVWPGKNNEKKFDYKNLINELNFFERPFL